MAERLPRQFFNRPTLEVAQGLLGKIFVFQDRAGIITETEAYIGEGDPACHAFRGKTPRTEVMFGPAGHTYVYFIYGMYHCLNFVTEAEGIPAAVLVRGVMQTQPISQHLNGPGKLCREFGITREHNNQDMMSSESVYVIDSPFSPEFEATPRIGIKKGKDKLWRYIVKKSKK